MAKEQNRLVSKHANICSPYSHGRNHAWFSGDIHRGKPGNHARSPVSLGLTIKVKGRHSEGQPRWTLFQQPTTSSHITESSWNSDPLRHSSEPFQWKNATTWRLQVKMTHLSHPKTSDPPNHELNNSFKPLSCGVILNKAVETRTANRKWANFKEK